MSIFEKRVLIFKEIDPEKEEETGNTVIQVIVSCKKQSIVSEKTEIFNENIEENIPEEFRGRFKLISKPARPVSNISRNKYNNRGVWEFIVEPENIKENEKKEKPKTTRTRRKTKNINSTSQE